MSIEHVAFIGLGTMGQGMVHNLLAAQKVVHGFNRSPGKVDELEARGMRVAPEPKRATAACSVVITCVSDDDALRSVALDPEQGVVAGLNRGDLWLDCGTTGLELTQSLAAAAEKRGATFLDAPITGSKLGARNGQLTFMVGGPREGFERALELFEIMGKAWIHVGDGVGLGQRAKYCLNMTQAVVLEGVLEGYALAKTLGVSSSAMSEIFENSAGKTGVGSFKTPYLRRGDFEPHFKAWLMHKDLKLALAQAAEHELPLPAAAAVTEVYDEAIAAGWGDEDFLATAKLLERRGRIRLSEPDAL